jgi:Asp-tRNA(Asn)/Glu-tRNA(Gln) amidotransferase A subunit family amidase
MKITSSNHWLTTKPTPTDDAATFEGAPIALQLTGKRYRDEEVVAAADVLSKIIQG